MEDAIVQKTRGGLKMEPKFLKRRYGKGLPTARFTATITVAKIENTDRVHKTLSSYDFGVRQLKEHENSVSYLAKRMKRKVA
jgi:hypothetical protein